MTLAINYIEIENFKSYYGKNILGPFHQVCRLVSTRFVCFLLISFNLRVLTRLLVQMVQENQMSSTLYYSSLDLEHKKYAQRKSAF